MEIPYADLESELKVDKIYHLSDIHIRLQKRHDEYRSVFKTLYKTLKTLKNKDKASTGIIVITGDILHSKTELSPECVALTAEFFQELANIMPLIILAGNHDANLNNQNRLDSLTPIVEKVMRKSTCYYLKETGIYRFGNLVFGVTSVFDYQVIKADLIDEVGLSDIDHKVALFHGRVDGAITDTGAVMEGEKGINRSSFDGYDFTLLGDIHKYQHILQDKIAYAGSLIQQNHGESQKNHGLLIWDLKTKTAELKEIPNSYGFITLKLRNGKLIKNKEDQIPSKCYLRLEIDSTITKEIREETLEHFKKNRTILELITIENDKNQTEKETQDAKSLSFNVTNDQFQNTEIEKYLKSKEIDQETITKIKSLNTIYNGKISMPEAVAGNSWKIKSLQFDDMFCYKNNNSINFSSCKGIVGIVGPNHTGKSSILDIILYTLFDKTSRKGTAKDLIRLGQKSFKTKLELQMGNKEFHITKKGTLKSNGTMSVQVTFTSYHDENGKQTRTDLNGKTPAETRRIIESYFGTFNDMVMTSISLQNNNTQFADATTTERRREFEKLLRIDVFEKLKDQAQTSYREKKAVIKHLTSTIPEDGLKNLLDEHLTMEEEYQTTEKNLKTQQTNLTSLRDQESGLMIQVGTLLNQIPSKYQKMAEKGELLEHKKHLEKRILGLQEKVKLSDQDYSKSSLENWQKKEKERIKKTKVLESQIRSLLGKMHPINGSTQHSSKLNLKEAESEFTDRLIKIKKIEKQYQDLKDCNWDEKEMILETCQDIHQKQQEKHPKQGDLILFYQDLEESVQEVLDELYKPGTEEDEKELQTKLISSCADRQDLSDQIETYKKIELNIQHQKENLKYQKEIDQLKDERQELDQSGFEIEHFQNSCLLKDQTLELEQLGETQNIIQEFGEKQLNLENVMEEVLTADKNLHQLSTRRGDLKGSLAMIEAEMKVLREKKKTFQKEVDETALLSTYLDCLKKVPFFIINTIVPQLERVVNQMLGSLVDFTLTVGITEKDLNVYICRPDGQIPLSNASGFEKFVGSLFLRMGLIRISNLPKANFIAIDEGWSNFDYENLNNVSLIMDYLRTEFDFVILISHLQVMREQTDQQITLAVSKKNGQSRELTSVVYPSVQTKKKLIKKLNST